MSFTRPGLPFLLSDDGRKIVGLKNPDNTDSGFGFIFAESFGADPSAAPTNNFTAIQRALNLGDTYITTPGTYFYNATLAIPSRTRLFLGAGVLLKLAAGSNCNLVRNANFGKTDGSHWVPITSITTTDGVVVTVVTTIPHGFSTGDYVHVIGAVQDAYNDVAQVTVVNSTTYTYSIECFTGATYTSPATFLSASFTGTTTNGSAVVTGVSSLTGLVPGMIVTGTNIPAGTRFMTFDSANQITLSKNATGANAGLTASFPLQCCKADVNIRIEGPGGFDQNLTNSAQPDGYDTYGICFRNIADSYIGNLFVNDSSSSVTVEGIYRSLIENIRWRAATTYSSNGIHPGSHCARDLIVRNVGGTSRDDCVSIVQKEYPQFMDMGTPFGSITRVLIENVQAYGTTSPVKINPNPGMVCDEITIRNVRGRSRTGNFIKLDYDTGNTGVYAAAAVGTIKNLRIENCGMTQMASGIFLNNGVKITNLFMDGVTLSGLTANGRLMVTSVNSSIERLSISNYAIDGAANPAIQQNNIVNHYSFVNGKHKNVAAFLKLEDPSNDGALLDFSNVIQESSGALVSMGGVVNVRINMNAVQNISPTSVLLLSQAGTNQFFLRSANLNCSPANLVSGTWNNATAEYSPEMRETITYAATITPNMLTGEMKTCTFTGAMTIAAPTGAPTSTGLQGKQLTFTLIRNSVGAAAITWNAAYVFPVAFVDSAADATRTTVVFRFDDNGKWRCVSGTNSWA